MFSSSNLRMLRNQFISNTPGVDTPTESTFGPHHDYPDDEVRLPLRGGFRGSDRRGSLSSSDSFEFHERPIPVPKDSALADDIEMTNVRGNHPGPTEYPRNDNGGYRPYGNYPNQPEDRYRNQFGNYSNQPQETANQFGNYSNQYGPNYKPDQLGLSDQLTNPYKSESTPHFTEFERKDSSILPNNSFTDPFSGSSDQLRPKDPFSTDFDDHNRTNYMTYDGSRRGTKDESEDAEYRARKRKRRRSKYHYTNLAYFTIIVSVIQVIVFIVELARMSHLTGSAFQTKPYFNPMLGPLTYLLINMGARYVPCMHQVTNLTDDTTITFPCANSTSVDTNVCNLSELCGLSGVSQADGKWLPDQWYRIFVPIFLHAGFLHIIFNLLLQVVMGATIEKAVGIVKFIIIYILSGIAGFLLGANFTPDGIASTGASGALFGVVATNIIMFAYSGRKNINVYGTRHYGLFICIMIAEIVVSFVLGLLPGLDNFSHIGGFAMGVLMLLLLLPDPFFIYNDGKITRPPKHMTMAQKFVNHWNPVPNHGDKILPRFYAWCCVRVVALVLAIVYFVLLAKNFFQDKSQSDKQCKWCKYINCIPVHGWCDIGQVTVETSSQPSATSAPVMTSVPSTMVITTSEPTTLLPPSIENQRREDEKGPQMKMNSIENFEKSFEKTDGTHKLLVGTVNAESLVGIGLYLTVGFMTYCFVKKFRSNNRT